MTVLIVQNGLQHKIGYYKPLGPNFIIICCLFSNFFFAYTVCLTFLKVILIKSIYKNKLENILLTKVSRRYSQAQGGKLEIPPAQKLSILSSAHREHGSAHTNVFAFENQSERELIMLSASLQCRKDVNLIIVLYFSVMASKTTPTKPSPKHIW